MRTVIHVTERIHATDARPEISSEEPIGNQLWRFCLELLSSFQSSHHVLFGQLSPRDGFWGANILVLPKSATLQNYYAADMQGDTILRSTHQLAESSLED
jgi:hypothetical protein